MASLIIHDTRLHGRTPLNYNFVKVVNASTTLSSVISTVINCAQRAGGRLDQVHIFCHGYEAHWNLGQQSCVPGAAGGFGLQLCAEGLSLHNVSRLNAWQNKVRRIVVYACAPADTGEGNEGTVADGRRFMGEMALWSRAEVIAARDTQYYHRVAANYAGGRTVADTIDFGAWEGPVFSFTQANPQGMPIPMGAYDMRRPTSLH